MKAAFLPRLLRFFSNKKVDWKDLVKRDDFEGLRQYIRECSSNELINSISWVKHQHPSAPLSTLEQPLSTRIQEFDYKTLIMVKTLFKVSTPILASAFEARAIELLPRLHVDDVPMMLSKFSEKFQRFPMLMPHIAEKLKESGGPLKINKKLQTLLSFYLSGHSVPLLDKLWVPQLMEELNKLSWIEIGDLMLIYGKTSEKRLMKEVENYALRNMLTINQDDIGWLCSAMSHVIGIYKSKLINALEYEIITRAQSEHFTSANIAKVFRGFEERISTVADVLESHISSKFDMNDLTYVMYCLGSNKKGNENTWRNLTKQLLDEGQIASTRSIAQGVYGAFYAGFGEKDFYDRMADVLHSHSPKIKEAEKLIPVYSTYRRTDVLQPCRELLLQDFDRLAPMRALALINWLKRADFMTPELYQLMMRIKGKDKYL